MAEVTHILPAIEQGNPDAAGDGKGEAGHGRERLLQHLLGRGQRGVDALHQGRRVVDEGLLTYLLDNVQSWALREDGSWVRNTPGANKPRSAQQVLLDRLGGRGEAPSARADARPRRASRPSRPRGPPA